jgi:hypothetical protein
MHRSLILIFFLLAGCATASRDNISAQPEFVSPAKGAVYVVAVRELDGTKKSDLVDGHYTSAAIHLATHSRTKIPHDAPQPTGKGYRMVFQLLDGSVIDQFDFWPEEVVVHGQRWRIEDKTTAWRARMMWFNEFPKEPNQPPATP